MATFRTPGVYVQEISTLPPSVAEVATAIPAFIGYTEFAVDEAGKPLTGTVVRRITSMLEYNQFFGGPQPETFAATVEGADTTISRTTTGTTFYLYYSLQLYFENGGGPCHIASLGHYNDVPAADDFTGATGGLAAISTVDEPTLLVFPDAVNLGTDYYKVCNAALAQCQLLGDRFAILDVLDTDVAGSAFRDGIRAETDFLKYGAAYTPYLNTSIPYSYKDTAVAVVFKSIKKTTVTEVTSSIQLPDSSANRVNFLTITHKSTTANSPRVVVVENGTALPDNVTIEPADNLLTIKINTTPTSGADIQAAWDNLDADKKGFAIAIGNSGDGSGGNIVAIDIPLAEIKKEDIETETPVTENFKLADLNIGDSTGKTALYNQVKQALAKHRATLPPSPAVAGAYARVDRIRGVWKSPANVSVVGISGPTRLVTSAQQEDLNVDAVSGKSINVIRSFTGKGTLVWGARTLAGNDNEWRYIAVRRLFNLIEESVQKSTSFAVFEPNDAGTWLKVKAMIDSYLYGLWQQGALAGSVPEQAYFVNVGLGKTMTTQDILEGRMNVEIGLAAVRPAEFIILKFSHKLQEA